MWGRCEGIFLIEAGECYIVRNKIQFNNDGIIALTSVPLVQNNIIEKHDRVVNDVKKVKNNLVKKNINLDFS